MVLQPTAAVVRWVAASFGLSIGDGAGLTPVARGAMGRIWRLDTGLGPAFALKELLWGGDEAAIRAEVAFCEAATADGRIEAPGSHRGLDGTYLCELPDGGGLVRLFDWADGEPLTRPNRASAGWVGRTLGRLHRLGHPVGPATPDPWYWQCPDEGAWQALIDRGPAWAGALHAARPRLAELMAAVPPDVGTQWTYCHLDLQPSNVLSRTAAAGNSSGNNGDDSGDERGAGHRFTLLDWENAGPASPERELAAALLTWYVDDAALAGMLREYRRAGGPVGVLSPSAFALAIATRVNYVYVQARAALDPDLRPEDRDHAERECSAAIAALPAPGLLATLRATANSSLGAIEA